MASNNVRMKIKGMTCHSCEARVARALEAAGAHRVIADHRREEAVFRIEGEIDEAKLASAVREASSYSHFFHDYRPEAIEALQDETQHTPD